MIVEFAYRLRDLGVPVGTTEIVALHAAVGQGVHGHTLTGFYHCARAILVHHEAHLDLFDQAFLSQFGEANRLPTELSDEILEWLDQWQSAQSTTSESPTTQELEQWLSDLGQRLSEQTERHDGGNHWVGTGGSSPHGQGGTAMKGLSTGSSGGGRAAVHLAQAHNYQGYRDDQILDIRTFEVALRRLRQIMDVGGEPELDVQATISATAANAGDIEVVTRPPRRHNTHVLLLADVGGSMTPHTELVSMLFSAATKASHFKDLQTFYFHNCIYGKVYATTRFDDGIWLPELLQKFDKRYQLIVVGDALMAEFELHMQSAVPETVAAMARLGLPRATGLGGMRGYSGMQWLGWLTDHYPKHVWLNPEPARAWPYTTIEQIAHIFPMYELTVGGLTEAMRHLMKTRG